MKYKFKMCVKKVDSLNLIYLNGQRCNYPVLAKKNRILRFLKTCLSLPIRMKNECGLVWDYPQMANMWKLSTL